MEASCKPRRGAEFLTLPKQHETEIRCYIRDPDGHLIEVGQTTLVSERLASTFVIQVVVGSTVSNDQS
jgi:hypothetical protein